MIAALRSGMRLAYAEAGIGTPLLLVHGWPHDRTLWHAQVSGLVTQARCIAPDLRGFGGSDAVGPLSIDAFADDLATLLDSLGLADAVVCGLSMGGYVALAMWRRHPARVRALVLTGTRASADTAEQRAGRERLVQFVDRSGMQALAAQQVERMTSASTREAHPLIASALEQLMAAAPSAGAVAAQRAMMARPDATHLLATITVPTLVIAGADDAIIPSDEQRAMAASIPGARFAEIPSAGHVAPFERAAAFNLAVGEFLETL